MLSLLIPFKGFNQIEASTFSSLMDSAEVNLKSDSALALAYSRQALALAQAQELQTNELEASYLIARIYYQHKDDLKSKNTLEIALKNAQNYGDNRLIAIGFLQLASTERGLNNTKAALSFYRKTIQISEPEKMLHFKAKALKGIGLVYKNSSNLDSAMVYSVRALKIFETLHDTVNTIDAFNQIGNINILAGNYDKAYKIFSQAEPLAYALRDSFELMNIFLRKGLVQHKNDHYEEALINYEEGIAIAKLIGASKTEAILYGNIGSSLSKLDKDKEGLPYLLKALAIKDSIHASTGSICHTLLDLSELYRNLKDYNEAVVYAKKVIELTNATNDDYYRQYGYLYLAEAQRAAGMNDLAYDHLLYYTDLKDSIFDAEKSEQLQELQVSYETEKKDAEIIALAQTAALERSQKYFYLFLVLFALALGFGVFRFQRAKTIKNKELLEKEKEVDALKTNFFANISHEFRTPLTLILGPIKSKLEQTTDEAERADLMMMERNAVRLQRLINDILDLAKNDAGKLELRNQPTQLDVVVNGLASSFQSHAEVRSIDYEIRMDKEISGKVIRTDQDKLETILINLLSNAFKFTLDHGSVSMHMSAKNNKWVEIKVSNSGRGIAPEKLNQIFERFYQVDDSSSRKAEGTGIGLAFSKELAILLGGDIFAESELQAETHFTLRIPFSVTESELIENTDWSEPYTPEKIHLEDALISLNPVHQDLDMESDKPLILLAEDNADVRTYISSILGDNYAIQTAINGEIGEQMAVEKIPDLIITDVMMPIMDGYELCHSLKSDIRTSHIPIVMLTAKSSAQSRIQGLETQADIYMSKPFNPKELKLQIRNLLSLHEKLKVKYQSSESLIPSHINLNSAEQKFLEKLTSIMEVQYNNSEFDVQQFSKEIGMSRSQLHRKLNATTGESPSQFVRSYRLKIAEKMLKAKTSSISGIAYDVGFNSVPYFNRCFQEKFGKRPGDVA